MIEFKFDGKNPVRDELDLGNLSDNDTRIIRFIFARCPDDADLTDAVVTLHVKGLGVYPFADKSVTDDEIAVDMPVTTLFTAQSKGYRCSFKFILPGGGEVWTTGDFYAIVSFRTDENSAVNPQPTPDIVDAAIAATAAANEAAANAQAAADALDNIEVLSGLSDIDGELGYKGQAVSSGGGTSDPETSIPCTPTDWQLSDGYYTLTIPAAVHTRGPAARCTGAESGADEDESRDAVISWRRLTNGTVLIYSDIPFAGRIFLKG